MLTFVVIDDDVHLTSGVRDILELDFEGCRVFMAHDGIAGLELIEQHSPDFIMCNYMMPKMYGDKVLQHLQEHDKTKNIPFLMNSASPQSAIGILRHVYGDDARKHFISNPFDAEDLLNQIKALLTENGTHDS
jgi:DNA-binding response OmpR family regulator